MRGTDITQPPLLACPLLGLIRFQTHQHDPAPLAALRGCGGTDFGMDKLAPPQLRHGAAGALDKSSNGALAKPCAKLVRDSGTSSSLQPVGSPETVAAQMNEAMQEKGGDGFLITARFHRISRQYITEATAGLVPALPRGGVVRMACEHHLLRDTLREF
jgi:hypothetical protein